MNFWASVNFDAKGGRVVHFLQKSAQNNLKLREVKYILGGITGKCEAKNYFELIKIAKKYHVDIKLKEKTGLYFTLKQFLSKKGIYIACLVFFIFWLWSQNFIWYIHFTGANDAQIARIRQILWQSNQITTGTYVTTELLEQGKQALLNWDNEFSWVSLNFNNGRLVVEVITAKDVPIIKQGWNTDLIASHEGIITYVNVEQGTAQVKVGQSVAKGQVLVSTARLEHDQETLVFSQTNAEIKAQFIWQGQTRQETIESINTPSGELLTVSDVYVFGQTITFPWWEEIDNSQSGVNVRKYQPSIWGFALPVTIIEKNYLKMEYKEHIYTKQTALFLAREECIDALFEQYPDAQLLQISEKYYIEDGVLLYECSCEVIANIVFPAN